jgi:hypothetical protein
MPLVLSPPTCFIGSMSRTFKPSRAAVTAAARPQGTPLYTIKSTLLASPALAEDKAGIESEAQAALVTPRKVLRFIQVSGGLDTLELRATQAATNERSLVVRSLTLSLTN